jgi:hypothetical protein
LRGKTEVWIADGIVNDPNRPDDPQYIVRLSGQIATVSLETVRLVRQLSTLSSDQQPVAGPAVV